MKTPTTTDNINSIIRVDHAGEYGARRIYDGQLAVLRGKPSHKIISEMKAQEEKHLDAFEALARERRVRPTVLMPLWHVGGWALGAATAALGEKAAMACTVAVESVIAEHYQEQVERLQDNPKEEALHATVKEFRDDEMEHHDTGLEHGAQDTPGYNALYHGVRAITKTAIALSKRV